MEIGKSFDYKKILIGAYLGMAVIFLGVGFMPAEATAQYEVSGTLEVPAIRLESEVTTLEVDNNKLNTPEKIVGSFSRRKNKTLLVGHASTVFGELGKVAIGDTIIYNGVNYTVVDATLVEKADVKMSDVLKREKEETLVLMTCAGEDLGEGDATHRFMITAKVL